MAPPWPLHQGQSGTGALKNPPSPPQKLEEVLVVVGGRVLEDGEDEERGLDTPAATRNFAFYNPKTSKCPPLPPPPSMLINHLSTPKPPLAKPVSV